MKIREMLLAGTFVTMMIINLSHQMVFYYDH